MLQQHRNNTKITHFHRSYLHTHQVIFARASDHLSSNRLELFSNHSEHLGNHITTPWGCAKEFCLSRVLVEVNTYANTLHTTKMLSLVMSKWQTSLTPVSQTGEETDMGLRDDCRASLSYRREMIPLPLSTVPTVPFVYLCLLFPGPAQMNEISESCACVCAEMLSDSDSVWMRFLWHSGGIGEDKVGFVNRNAWWS